MKFILLCEQIRNLVYDIHNDTNTILAGSVAALNQCHLGSDLEARPDVTSNE